MKKEFNLPKLGRLTVKLKDGTSVTHENVALVSSGAPVFGEGNLRFHIMSPKAMIYEDGEWTEFFVERQK